MIDIAFCRPLSVSVAASVPVYAQCVTGRIERCRLLGATVNPACGASVI
jgi:hypothetical protein